MPTNWGNTFNKGIKYIKINKIDKNGIDNTNRLQGADSLIINYVDVGPTQYNILSTQVQQDYYLFGIIPNEATSSQNEILDYNFSTAKNYGPGGTEVQGILPLNTLAERASINTWGSVTGNNSGYFTSSSGVFLLPMTPNTRIDVSCSFLLSGSGTGTANVFVYSAISGTLDGISQVFSNLDRSTLFAPYTASFSLNNFALENSYIMFGVYSSSISGSGEVKIVGNFNLVVTQSQLTSSATSSIIVINPPEDFFYSDYNPLYGNATEPQYSSIFMDVDYTTNYTSPINFELLISGTADKAQISDYNYASKAWTNIRYNGIKGNSFKFT
jgi:hypothetical protein